MVHAFTILNRSACDGGITEFVGSPARWDRKCRTGNPGKRSAIGRSARLVFSAGPGSARLFGVQGWVEVPRSRQGSESPPMRIFISAGEPSGDLHAANLIRSLRVRLPDAEFVGFGGARMAEAGAAPALSAGGPCGDVVPQRVAEPVDVHPADLPGRSGFPGRTARRRGADRLPGPALVDRRPCQGARHPGFLLRPAAAVGLGGLAGEEGPQVRRSGLVQPAVRTGLVSGAGCRRGRLRRPSLLRRAGRSSPG